MAPGHVQDAARQLDARWAANLEAPEQVSIPAPLPAEAFSLGALPDEPPTLPNNLPLLNLDREVSALRPRPSEVPPDPLEARPQRTPQYRGRTPSELSALYQAMPSTDAPRPPLVPAPPQASRGYLPKAPYEYLPPPPPPSKRSALRAISPDDDEAPTQTKTPAAFGVAEFESKATAPDQRPYYRPSPVSPLPPPVASPVTRIPAPPLLPTGLHLPVAWEASEWTDSRHGDPVQQSPRLVAPTVVATSTPSVPSAPPQESISPAAMSIPAPASHAPLSGWRGGWVAVAGASVLGAAVSAGAFLLPARGQLLVDVTNQAFTTLTDAQVYVNDELVCSQSPCAVKLEATTQRVRVTAPGYQASTEEAVVLAEGAVTLHKVQMGASADTGIDVQTNFPNLQLYIDGRRVGGLPRKVMGLAPGEHVVVVSGGDHYTTEERRIHLEPNQTLLIDDLQPSLRSAALELLPGENSRGARVTLNGEVVSLPLRTNLEPGRSYALEASRSGYTTLSRVIEVDASQPLVQIPVSLEEETSPTAGQDTASSSTARWVRSARRSYDSSPSVDEARSPGSSAESSTGPKAPASTDASADSALGAAMRQSVGLPADEPPRKTASGATDNGWLNIVTTPSAVVLLDGKPVGKTPKRLSVTAGPHSIVLMHEGGRKRASVQVEGGSTKTIKASF